MLCTVHGPGGLSVKARAVAGSNATNTAESAAARRFVLMPSSFSRPLYRDGHGRVRRGPSHRPDLECQSGCDAHYMSEPCLELLLTDPICAQRGSETSSPRRAACDTT